MKLLFDYDFLLFKAAPSGERRWIVAKNIETGEEHEFSNVTEFKGRGKKIGGWLATQAGMLPEHFVIEQKQELLRDGKRTAEVIVDSVIGEIKDKLNCRSYSGFVGKGKVFRHELATLQEYKGNRDGTLDPLLRGHLRDYLIRKHKAVLVTGIEADDAMTTTLYDAWNVWKKNGKKDADKVVGCAVDKDARGTSGWHFNPNKDDAPRLVEGFGHLYLDDKDKPEGDGRMWMMYQCLAGDGADDYAPHVHSEVYWGEKTAFDWIKDCKNDKELWTKAVEAFYHLYPEPKEITTFRGTFTIDAMYVFQEMVDMAHMQRWEGDRVIVKDVLDKLEINYVSN